jgi:type 1 glutamine amidotransferase
MKKILALVFIISSFSAFGKHHGEKKPLKAFMITGGCCHDYKQQKNIISEGISERVPTKWDIFFEMDEKKSKARLSKKGWADQYDFIVYNHCFAHEKDAQFIQSITDIHKAGKPAIALHCAMHSYHWSVKAEDGKKKAWPEMLGASSKGHGPKAAITLKKVKENAKHPILKDMPDGWLTPEGELYNVQEVYEGTTVLAHGENGKAKEAQACVWVNTHGKGRIFSTTLGHHNSTMSSKEYLDMLGNAVRWVNGKK